MKTVEDFKNKIDNAVSFYIGEPITEKTKDNIRREITTIFIEGKQLGVLPNNAEITFAFRGSNVHVNIGDINESSKDDIPDSKECEQAAQTCRGFISRTLS